MIPRFQDVHPDNVRTIRQTKGIYTVYTCETSEKAVVAICVRSSYNLKCMYYNGLNGLRHACYPMMNVCFTQTKRETGDSTQEKPRYCVPRDRFGVDEVEQR